MSIKITGASGRIRVLEADPSSPKVLDEERVYSRDLWILHIPGGASTTSGTPMGLLLVWTYPGNITGGTENYELSGNTTGGIKRFTL